MAVLEKEINMIEDEEIRENTRKILSKYEEKIKTQPTSLSGKYHKSDPIVEIHLKRAFWFVVELCREFKIEDIQKDILFSAILLHDIGVYEYAHKGNVEGCIAYFPETGWCKMKDSSTHPLDGQLLIAQTPFKYSDKIGKLISEHMSHWYRGISPEPDCLCSYIICIADYLASRESIKIEGI